MMPASHPFPKREDEIQPKRSFFRFVFSFGLCVFLGLISHYFISRYPLKERILKDLKVPENYELEIYEMGLRFRRGLMPVVALTVDKLELKQRNCSMQSLVARDILMVFKPLSLLFGELKPKEIHINDFEFNQPGICFFPKILNSGETQPYPPKPGESFTAKTKTPTTGIYEKNPLENEDFKKIWKKVNSSRLKEIFSEISKILQSAQWNSYQPLLLKIREGEFKWIQDLNRQIILKAGLSVKLKSSVQGHLSLNQLKMKNKKIPMKSNILFTLDHGGLDMGIKMGLREGKVKADLKIFNKDSFPTSMNFKINRLPVSFFDVFLESSFHYLWFNCSGQLSSDWEALEQERIHFDDCGLTGPYGDLIFSDIQARFFSILSARVKINKLNLDKVLKNRRSFQLAGIFENYGVLSMEGIHSGDQSEFGGFLENSKILFSKNHFRDLQPISKTSFHITGGKNKWEMIIADMDIKEGDFRGEFKFQADRRTGELSGAMNVPHIQLSPAIYRLMLDSKPSPFKISGKFQWSKGVMKNWFMDMEIPLLKSKTYKIHDLSAHGQPGAARTSLIEVRVPRGEIYSDSKWIHWIKSTTLGKIQTGPSVKFRDFIFKFKLFRDRSLQWNNGAFRLTNGWRLSSYGSRDSQKQFKAHIRWSYPNKSPLEWFYQGELFKGQWQARTHWINQWLMNHGDFLKEHPHIQISPSFKKKKNEKKQD